MKISHSIVIILILYALAACKNNDEYRVCSDFTQYIVNFKAEAASRGRSFNFENSGLIVEFADLKDGVAGLCHYENPIRIEIDKTYWNAIGKSAGVELMREHLLFHELGHGILNRKHLNTILPNGDWKSIMCGGDKVNNKSWNINYRQSRRKYYIDELFNEKTLSPEIMNTTFSADTSGFYQKTKLNFDSPKQAWWKLVDTMSYKTTIESGRFRFESRSNRAYLVYMNTSVSVLEDFSYQLDLESTTPNSEDMFGIIFGYIPAGSDGSKDPIEYMTISTTQKIYIGNRSWYSFYAQLYAPLIINSTTNTLKVSKLGGLIYYFINGNFVYCSESGAKHNGNKFGFIVPPRGVVYLDNLSISVKTTTSKLLKRSTNENITFEIKNVDPIKHNLLINK